MSNLADLVEPLKREIAVPGAFDALFPDTLDSDLVATLVDALWEAKLDGFFGGALGDGTTSSGVAVDHTTATTVPDVSDAAKALLVIYAGVRILRSELRNRNTHFRAEAGPAVFERDQSATLLKGLLDQLEARKRQLLVTLILRPSTASSVYTLDGYAIRGFGFYDWELAGAHPLSLDALYGPASLGP